VNVVGASLGALLAPWVLIRFYGIRGAVLAAAGANLAAAVLALVAGRWAGARAEGPGPTETAPATSAVAGAGASLRLWAALYALSGFCALSLEIVYFRLVEIAVKSTAFTFGTVLSLYLLGSALGSFAGAPLAPRLARPLRAFLLAQCALIALSAAAVGLIVWLPPDAPGLSWYVRYWGGELPAVSLGSSEDPGGLARLYLALPLFLFGLPTFLMGLSFPILQRAVHHEADEAGRRVGLLQAANIAGCVLGSLLVGLVTLSVAGTIGTLRLLLALGVGFAGLGLAREGLRSAFTPAALVLAGLLAALPDGRALWLRMHGVTGALEQAVVAEDATGVGAIFPTGGRLAVMIGGLYHSWLPFGGVHTRLGAAPAVLHPAPRDVAIIGLASGDTPWAAGVRKETRSITVFEIFRPQPRLLAAAAAFPWAERPALDPLRAFLGDPRVAFVIGDGRKALEREARRYDVIEADALWPETAMSGNLYSVEFYELVARRLKPGGLMCSWTPTPRIRRTFRQVFPYVIALEGGGISVGSREPLALDPAAWRARLETPEAVAYLGREAVADVAERLERAQLRTDPPRREVNRDLYPKDEFLAPDRGRGESR
jgi:SAM-dependent methyltransferase